MPLELNCVFLPVTSSYGGPRHVARFVGIFQFTTTTTLCQNTYLIIFRTECPIVIIFIYLELTR